MCHLKLITGCKIYVWFKFNISCVLVWADWLICLELDASGLSPKYLVGLLSTSNFYQITLSLINWSAHAYKRAFLNPSLGHWNPWKQSVSAIFERWLKYCVFFHPGLGSGPLPFLLCTCAAPSNFLPQSHSAAHIKCSIQPCSLEGRLSWSGSSSSSWNVQKWVPVFPSMMILSCQPQRGALNLFQQVNFSFNHCYQDHHFHHKRPSVSSHGFIGHHRHH